MFVLKSRSKVSDIILHMRDGIGENKVLPQSSSSQRKDKDLHR